MQNNPAADPDELWRFIDCGGQVRLVNNLRTGELERVAFWRPGEWDWQELPVEGPVEGVIRKTFVNLVTQSLPGIAPPTSMDQALSKAAEAVEPISVQDMAGKLANIAGQALACHAGFIAVAKQAGAALEAVVVSMPFPASPSAEALNAATIGVVAFDLNDARLTSTVTDFFAGWALPRIGAPSVSRGNVRTILKAQQSSRGSGLPQPGEEPPPEEGNSSPSQARQPDAAEQPTRRLGLRSRPG